MGRANGTWLGRLLARFADWRARRGATRKKRRDDQVRRMVAKEIAWEKRLRPQLHQEKRK
jgi:hypothetical protein